jgi:hypothetical protein
VGSEKLGYRSREILRWNLDIIFYQNSPVSDYYPSKFENRIDNYSPFMNTSVP